jgi:hypothetical protein
MPVRLVLFQGLLEDRLEEETWKICKFLNVGHGDMQVRTEEPRSETRKISERGERYLAAGTDEEAILRTFSGIDV